MKIAEMVRACVKINFFKLQSRLSAERGHDVDPIDVKQWLEQMGFTRHGDWQCERDSLRHLHGEELIAMRTLSTSGGITFVDSAFASRPPR
jgi:hypothetical protein